MTAFRVAPAGAASAEPSIRVVPRSTPAGQQVSVVGVDYCAGGGCSPVTVTVSQKVLAQGVAVQPDGTFNVPVRINEPEGEHEVVATQSSPAGILRATATVIVATLDTVPRTTVPGTPSTAELSDPVTTTNTSPGTVAPPSTVPTTTVTSATAPLSPARGDDANDDPWWLALLAVVAAAAAVAAALVVRRARRRRHLPDA